MSLSTEEDGFTIQRPRETVAECRQRIVEAERSLALARQSLDALVYQGLAMPTALSTPQVPPAQVSLPASPPQQPKADLSQSFGTLLSPASSAVDISDILRTGTNRDLKSSWKSEADRVQRALVDQVIIDDIAPTTDSSLSFKKKLHSEVHGEREGPPRLEMQKIKHAQSRSIYMRPVCYARFRIPVLHPEAKFRIGWMVLGFAGILYEACAIPFFLAFRTQAEGFWIVINSIVNMYFIVDIPLSFISGYRDEKGALHMNPSGIALKYLSGWFLFDLFCGIPWEWIDDGSGAGVSDYSLLKSSRLLKAIRMLRLLRLLHIMKRKDVMENAQIHLEANAAFGAIVGVIKTILIAFTITHWCACLWYHIGMGSVLPHEITWIDLHLGNYPEISQRYAVSLYFTLTTMTTVGYGDLHPQTITEMQFGMLLLCVATVVFATLMGTLTDIIHNMNSKSHALAEKKEQLGCYMRWRAVPLNLARHIRQHLVYLWDDQSYQVYEDDIRKQLSPVLRAELSSHVYGPMIYTAPFFAWLWDYDVCVQHLANMVESSFLEDGDYIFRKGDDEDTIYVLICGSVWISPNSRLLGGGLGSGEDGVRRCGSNAKVDGVGRTLVQLPHAIKSPSLHTLAEQTATATAELINAVSGHDKVTSDKTPAKVYGIETTGHELFDSEMLLYAVLEQRRQDVRKKRAATKLQKWWKRYLTKGLCAKTAAIAKGAAKPGMMRMASRMVVAPAYFGESCLWFPMEEWREKPHACMYNAQCQCRSEVVCIPRSAVLSVIEHFSPWLAERFECFRSTVTSRLGSAGQGGARKPNGNLEQEDGFDSAVQDGAHKPNGNLEQEDPTAEGIAERIKAEDADAEDTNAFDI